MIQNQLIDYINAQMKLGVTRDAVRSALVGAGWNAADVDDTLKSMDSGKAGMAGAAVAGAKPGATTAAEPQVIKVSDLVSASPSLGQSPASSPSVMPSGTAFKDGAKSPLTGPAVKPSAAAMSIGTPITSYSSPIGKGMGAPHSSRGALVTEIILGILFVVAGGMAGFLYYQNTNLAGQLSALNGQSAKVNLQLSTLQSQTVASTTALTGQVGALSGEIQELKNELAFYAAPPNTSSTATSTLVTGTVAPGARGSYIITGAYGGKVTVENAKASSTIAALTPLVGTSTVSQFAGTSVPGSGIITLTAVNGVSL